MKNLFVANIPFQFLTSYLVASNYGKEDDNYLLVLRPYEYQNWAHSTGIQYALQDKSVWEKVFIVEKWLERNEKNKHRQQLGEMKKRIEAIGKIDRVFLSSDQKIQNQLIVELAGCSSYSLTDEGINSYIGKDRHLLSRLWNSIRVQYFRQIGHISPVLKYNFRGLGYGLMNEADYLYRPELLFRASNRIHKIEKASIQPVLDKIASQMSPIPLFEEKEPCAIFLGSTALEHGMYTMESEINVLKNLDQIARNHKLKLIYKTHHSENRAKLEKYFALFPEMLLFKSLEPVELLCHKYANIRCLISSISSGLIFIDTFTNHKISPIAVLKLYGKTHIPPKRLDIFKKTSVLIPDNWAETEKYFREAII